MLIIPKGVTSVTSARKFAGDYPKILKDIEAVPYGTPLAIGIEQGDEVKLVAIKPDRYTRLVELAREAQENRILKAAEEGIAEYERGETTKIDEAWLRKEYSRLGMEYDESTTD